MANVNPLPPQNPNLVRGLYPEVSTTGALVSQEDILLAGLSGSLANNPQFIGQVTLEEVHHDELEIVDHPIQQGSPITDHVFKKPAELTLHIGWAGAQLIKSGLLAAGAPSAAYLQQLSAIYYQLLQGQQSGVLYTVMTGKRQYTQMAIRSIVTQSDKDNENVLAVTLSMRQLFIVNTQIVSVSAPQGAQPNAPSTNPVQQNGRGQLGSAPNFSYTAFGALL